MAISLGFFGKLPARGDFVRTGLPRDFVSCWDAWLSAVLPAAVQAAGDGWLQTRAWRFYLAPGVCGAQSVTGLLFPSIDKVGRRFPLTLAWLDEDVDAEAMAAAERLGRVVVDQALSLDELADGMTAIRTLVAERSPQHGSLWWKGDDQREALVLPGLPEAGTFAEMMTGDVHDC
jgi:type VI secretion system protein ImpM